MWESPGSLWAIPVVNRVGKRKLVHPVVQQGCPQAEQSEPDGRRSRFPYVHRIGGQGGYAPI